MAAGTEADGRGYGCRRPRVRMQTAAGTEAGDGYGYTVLTQRGRQSQLLFCWTKHEFIQYCRDSYMYMTVKARSYICWLYHIA